jgi:hypothetical protein
VPAPSPVPSEETVRRGAENLTGSPVRPWRSSRARKRARRLDNSLPGGKTAWHILGGMERHTPWFQLVAVILVVIGLAILAAPAPAQAMDPQLMLALASTAGAIALIVGYLIVANGREKQRAASLEGIYACGDQEASGPMGCGTPSGRSASAPVMVATPDSPMAADGRGAPTQACPAGQAAGPMGCGAPEPAYSASAAAAPTIQGQ